MKVSVYTLGCKTNQYESELITESFKKNNCTIVDFKEKADIYIINSCVVTMKAEAETRKAISESLSRNPKARVILTGCFASLHEDFHRENVTVYNGRKSNLYNFALASVEQKYDLDSESIFSFSERTRAVLKIEEGCNNFCSYCIVPYVKGHIVQSKSIEKAIEEAKTLVNNGFNEIVLSGTEIGKYGEDRNTSLSVLLRELKKVEGLKRLRISSIHPKHVTDDLIHEIEPPIVPHLHISLQSGDNEVLKNMKRGYTREDYLKLVDKLRKKDNRFSISTDIIVGFPGETEDAFFNSIYMVRTVQFSKVHIFRFSKRPYTPAFFMKETSSEEQKKVRSERLKEYADYEQKSFKEKFLSEIVEVLVEEENEFLEGFTPYYLKVKFKGKSKQNDLAKVKIEKVDSNFMYGVEI